METLRSRSLRRLVRHRCTALLHDAGVYYEHSPERYKERKMTRSSLEINLHGYDDFTRTLLGPAPRHLTYFWWSCCHSRPNVSPTPRISGNGLTGRHATASLQNKCCSSKQDPPSSTLLISSILQGQKEQLLYDWERSERSGQRLVVEEVTTMQGIKCTKSLENCYSQETVQLRLTCHGDETTDVKKRCMAGKKMNCRSFEDIFTGEARHCMKVRLLHPTTFVRRRTLMLPRYRRLSEVNNERWREVNTMNYNEQTGGREFKKCEQTYG